MHNLTTRMTKSYRGLLWLAVFVTVLLTAVSTTRGSTDTQQHAVAGTAVAHQAPASAQIRPLGDDRYEAIIPLAAYPDTTYSQEPHLDTYVDSVTANSSYCNSTKLAVQYNSDQTGMKYQRAFLGFHLSAIPDNAVIDFAAFYAYLYDAWGMDPVDITLRQVKATWQCPLYWPGPASADYKTVAVSATPGWKYWEITSLVKIWKGKDFGETPNYGFELRGPESGGSKYYHYRYFRSQNANSNHPYIKVSYHLPATDTPTPTSTPTSTPTHTPTPTSTPTPTPTPTNTPTPTPTPTPTSTSTPGEPLRIISGPTVDSITRTSVTIHWKTNRSADSRAHYGMYAIRLDESVKVPGSVTEHQITLTGLQPATTYAFEVESVAGGDRVSSSRHFFRTAAPSDSGLPTASGPRVRRLSGDMARYQIESDVEDDTGIDHVSFYMNGDLLATDYSGGGGASFVMVPAAMGMSWADFSDTSHQMKVTATDLAGRIASSTSSWSTHEPTEIVMYLSPGGDYTYYVAPVSGAGASEVQTHRALTLTVYAEEQDWNCDWRWLDPGLGRGHLVWDCDTHSHAVDHVNFYIDDTLVYTSTPSSDRDYIHDYGWDTSYLSPNDYRVRAVAVGRSGDTAERTATIHVLHGERMIEMSRNVYHRGDNGYLDVYLSIHNTGTWEVQLGKVFEHMTGFMPFDTDGTFYTSEFTYNDTFRRAGANFDLFEGAHDFYPLQPGDSVTIHYKAVPILMPDDSIPYAFGDGRTRVEGAFARSVWFLEASTPSTEDGAPLADAVSAIQASSDYLVVTSPGALRSLYDRIPVESLLQSMVDLAIHRNGIIGFLPFPCSNSHDARRLIHHWGETMMGSDGSPRRFRSNGYLVLVGEDEIVPSWDPDFTLTGFDNIRRSDLFFANTADSYVDPEIIVSRIIGNTPELLETAIRSALAVRSDMGTELPRERALVVSGKGDGEDTFRANAVHVAGQLRGDFTSVTRDTVSAIEGRGEDPATWFREHAAGQNVLLWRDHGLEDMWCGLVDTGDFPVNFGSTHPFAFASSCLAGSYAGIYGIAEAFMESGSPVYIGATEISPRGANNRNTRRFFEHWLGHDISLGRAFRDLKRDIGGSLDDYWSVEYQMYGDPKLGGSDIAAAASRNAVALAAPPTDIDITVPDYVIEEYDGYHHVTIPGGQTIAEPNFPVVPMFTVDVPLPVGYRVQEVTLVSRSEPTTVEGLHLFSGIESSDAPGVRTTSALTEDSWWPTEPFDWEAVNNPDGTGTLRIHAHAFTYNPTTLQARFYKEYTFQVRYTVSPVEIILIEQGPLGYGTGQETAASLWVQNSGQPQDAVVSATVRRDTPGSEAHGLLLRTLKDLQGLAFFPIRWDTDGFEPGQYLVQVDLHAPDGDLLDRAMTTVQLGTVSAQATNLKATPASVNPGDQVNLSLDFKNTGTVPITGTAIIQVLSFAKHETVATIRKSTGPVAPGASTTISATWSVPPDGLGLYKFAARVLYNARSTDPLVAVVSSGQATYLPVVVR